MHHVLGALDVLGPLGPFSSIVFLGFSMQDFFSKSCQVLQLEGLL
jgi:hypothetical protein